jgi:hypothetical protein
MGDGEMGGNDGPDSDDHGNRQTACDEAVAGDSLLLDLPEGMPSGEEAYIVPRSSKGDSELEAASGCDAISSAPPSTF